MPEAVGTCYENNDSSDDATAARFKRCQLIVEALLQMLKLRSLSHLKKCACYFNFREVGKEPHGTCKGLQLDIDVADVPKC